MKKSDILKMTTVGVVSFGLVGFEIKGFDYDIYDYVYVLYVDWEGKPHRRKINFDKAGNGYFMSEVGKVYFSDCFRSN